MSRRRSFVAEAELPASVEVAFATLADPSTAHVIDPAVRRYEPDAFPMAVGTRIRIAMTVFHLPLPGVNRRLRNILVQIPALLADFQKTLKAVSHEEIMHFVLLTQYFDTLNHIGSNGKNTSILIPHSPAAMKDFQDQITQGTFIGTKLGEATEGDK